MVRPLKVLDRSQRKYGTNPYTGLDNPDGDPFLFARDVDAQAKAMQRIIALEADDNAFAWTLDAIASDTEATPADINDNPAIFFWTTGQSSALDGETFIDNETGSTWNIVGAAVEGPMAGSQLNPITFVRTYWFFWSTFRRDSTLNES